MSALKEFVVISQQRMCKHYVSKLEACLEKLDEEQLWDVPIEIYFPEGGYKKTQVSDIMRETFLQFENELHNAFTVKPEEINIGKLYHVVEHTGYHLGQIVDRTKLVTQASFQFCQNGINEKNLRETINCIIKINP